MDPENVDRIIREVRLAFSPDHAALFDAFAEYLKNPEADDERGVSLSYHLGIIVGGLLIGERLFDLEAPNKLMALVNLKMGVHDCDDATLRQLAYPSVWDRLMRDD